MTAVTNSSLSPSCSRSKSSTLDLISAKDFGELLEPLLLAAFERRGDDRIDQLDKRAAARQQRQNSTKASIDMVSQS